MIYRLRRFSLLVAFLLGGGMLLYTLRRTAPVEHGAGGSGRCRSCHNETAGTPALPYHDGDYTGDPTTEGCLSCHDGAVACDHSAALAFGRTDHPVGRAYPPMGQNRWFAPFPAVESAGAMFVDGKTTCLSCHNMSNPPPHLIRPAKDLCFVCHLF